MKKLSKAVQLLWKAYKRELELKEDVNLLNEQLKLNRHLIDMQHTEITRLTSKCSDDEKFIDELKRKLRTSGHIIRYRIQKFTSPYSMSPYSMGIKLSEEGFKNLVEDSKLKMVNEMIEKGLIKMIEYDDCTEIAIHLAEDIE